MTWEREQHLRKLADAATRAARHRRFHWCRRPNGFSDLPIWRMVASKLSLPLYQVQAFGNRLEELANGAANVGLPRGSIEGFDAAEFGMSLGMPEDDAARIFVALEDAGWVKFDHIADFYSRNPDKEDDTANERQQRKRTRDGIRRLLAKLAMQGKLNEIMRRAIEATLMGMPDERLLQLHAQLARAELSLDLATVEAVTREIFESSEPPAELSTVTRDSRLSRVTFVTSRQSREDILSTEAVDNSGDADAAPGAGPAGAGIEQPQSPTTDATRWMDSDGKELLVLRLECLPQKAEQMIERWRRDLQDDAALKEIIQGAVSNLHSGARFHIVIADGVQRFIRARAQGSQKSLPLNPVNLLKRSAS